MNGCFYDVILSPIEQFHLGDIRSKLLRHAHGKTLEIGAGTGLNFSHYPSALDLTATDPDPSMLKRAERLQGPKKLEIADAQELPYPDETFDTVVATLVFCSVPDPDRALKKVHRVLKAGGNFLLLEHVRKNTFVAGKVLDLLTPAWKHVAGGCHLNRDPEEALKSLGFQTIQKEILWKGFGKMWLLKK